MPTLEFKGKQFVYAHHLTVPFRPLVIDEKKSLPPKGEKPTLDDNLIIHGDNLHGLKALLPTLAGKVKCVVIDPPYNTGVEGWAYNDSVNSPLMRVWLGKVVALDDLERHDKWLSMMWPRLTLLRDLMSDDGLIFVNIDDNEEAHLRMLMDDIFTLDCFVARLIWKSRQHLDSRTLTGVSVDHEYVLVYSRTAQNARLLGQERDETKYSNPDKDPRGPWMSRSMLGLATKAQRPNLHYDIVDPATRTKYPCPPDTGWRYNQETMGAKLREDRILFPKKNDGRPREKVFLKELKGATTGLASIIDDVFTAHGSQEIRDIFGDQRFAFPKPSSLIRRLIMQVPGNDFIVLDSFAGSAPTAQAVMDANKADNGTRRFILIECEDYADTLTAERVRRVIKGYKFEWTKKEELYRRPVNISTLKKAHEILASIEGIENLERHRFARITKKIENDTLIVTGEKKITENVDGLGGSFTFCILGDEITMEGLLSGNRMPDYESLAKYVFYTATGQTLGKVPKTKADWFIGETANYRVHLIYRPDRN